MADVLRIVPPRRARIQILRAGFLAAVAGACVIACALIAGSSGAQAASQRAPGAPVAGARASQALANPFGKWMFGISTDGTIQNEPHRTLIRELNEDAGTGAKWLRIDINWAQIQKLGRRSYNWTSIDALVKDAEARGMQVLGVLIYTPKWAEARRSCTLADCAPKTADFAAFAKAAVAHYAKRGVNDYEIWSEENSTAQWLPRPSPAAYTRLLKAAYPVIKSADPVATVITGGTSPSLTNGIDWSPVAFLAQLYKDGAEPYFDAVGAHPYCWPAYPGQPYAWSAWYQTYGAKDSMRSVMVANGDSDKRIWGTEFGAATYGPPGTYVNLRTQAKMIYDGYKLWSTYSWAGPLILFEGRDELKLSRPAVTSLNYMGLQYRDFAKKPAYAAYQRAVAAF